MLRSPQKRTRDLHLFSTLVNDVASIGPCGIRRDGLSGRQWVPWDTCVGCDQASMDCRERVDRGQLVVVQCGLRYALSGSSGPRRRGGCGWHWMVGMVTGLRDVARAR